MTSSMRTSAHGTNLSVGVRLLLFAGFVVAAFAPAAKADDFDTVVAPLLARKCLGCHNATDKKGGLNLAASKAALAGGESGPAFVPGKLDESLLWEKISQNEMPPKKPLAEDEKEILNRWISGGAKWGSDPIDLFKYSSATRAGYDWWSLKPLRRPALPKVADEGWARYPLDQFVLAGLEARGLKPSPVADKRTLIRRLSFDLLRSPLRKRRRSPPFLADDAPRCVCPPRRAVARIAALRRALGATLARRGPLRREPGVRARQAADEFVAVPRLGHLGHERRSPVR